MRALKCRFPPAYTPAQARAHYTREGWICFNVPAPRVRCLGICCCLRCALRLFCLRFCCPLFRRLRRARRSRRRRRALRRRMREARSFACMCSRTTTRQRRKPSSCWCAMRCSRPLARSWQAPLQPMRTLCILYCSSRQTICSPSRLPVPVKTALRARCIQRWACSGCPPRPTGRWCCLRATTAPCG